MEECKKAKRGMVQEKVETPETEPGQAEQIESLKTELKSLKKDNAELMNTVEPIMSEVQNLRYQVEELAAKDDVERDSEEWVDDGWPTTPKTSTAETDCGWADKDEDYLTSSEKGEREDEVENNEDENRDDEDTPGESGEAEEEGGNDDNGDDAHGDEQRDEWGIAQGDGWGTERHEWGNEQDDELENDSPNTVPDDDECDDGAEEYWAEPYTSSTFCRRLNMLSPHQVSLPRLDQIEDFDNWDNALREICKFLEITNTLDGCASWGKSYSENDEEHDWLEFLISQSLSAQFKKMLEDEVPGGSVSDKYANLKEKLPYRRRFRRAQLMAQLDKLSHATSGDNVPEYLDQFLSIREKLLNLGEDGKATESAIFGRFYNGLRGQAFTYLVQYQMYQSMKAEGSTVLSFANYAGHLLGGGIPQGYY